jgi:hypothetical protein
MKEEAAQGDGLMVRGALARKKEKAEGLGVGLTRF